MAKGSLMETETFLMLAVRLDYLTPQEVNPTLNLIVEISKMLTALRKRLLES
ncbi:MAG: four helix bundle protein [Pseudanabaena sp.]